MRESIRELRDWGLAGGDFNEDGSIKYPKPREIKVERKEESEDSNTKLKLVKRVEFYYK